MIVNEVKREVQTEQRKAKWNKRLLMFLRGLSDDELLRLREVVLSRV